MDQEQQQVVLVNEANVCGGKDRFTQQKSRERKSYPTSANYSLDATRSEVKKRPFRAAFNVQHSDHVFDQYSHSQCQDQSNSETKLHVLPFGPGQNEAPSCSRCGEACLSTRA